MADNTDIATGVGAAVQTWSTKDLGSGVKAHRAIPAWVNAGGVLLDTSTATPLPVGVQGTVQVSGPQTDAQARATPQPVDTELPAAAAPGDTDANAAIPAVASRLQGYNPATAQWRRVFSAASDGSGGGDMGRALQVAPQVYDSAAAGAYTPRTARSMTDAEAGQFMPAAAQMQWSGSAWERCRGPYSETLLAAADRTAAANSPIVRNYGFAGVIIAVTIFSPRDAAATASDGLTLKIQSQLSTGSGITILSQASAAVMSGLGRYYFVLYPGASTTSTGGAPQPVPTTSSPYATAPEWPVACVPLPLPPAYAVQVFPRGPTAGLTWNYSVTASYIP